MLEIWESLTIADRIQAGIASATFLAVLVALFEERFWRWVERPRIEISFNRNSDRCFRWATVQQDNVQDDGLHMNVRRQYFRLKVKNNGGLARNLRIRVDVFMKNQEIKRFEPSTLRWISGREMEDLANGESEYLDFLSQVLESSTRIQNRLRIEVYNAAARGIAWDRPLAQYNYRVVVYGDNIQPKTFTARFMPYTEIKTPGRLTIKEDC